MMSIELVLASNNDHKHAEFRRLFPDAAVLPPRDLGVDVRFRRGREHFF